VNSKQRMRALLTGEVPDRIGKADAPWPETRARWRAEGIPDRVHASDHFQMDARHMFRTDISFRLAETVEEDGPDWQVVRTPDGGLTKFWKTTGVPQHLAFGIRDRADWRRLRERLTPSTDRIGFGYYGDYAFEYTLAPYEAVRAAYQACATAEETCVFLSVSEPYESFLEKMGDERLLMTLADDPEWVAEMFDAHVAFVAAQTDLLLAEGFRPDAVFLGGDIAYRNGLLFSPAMYRDLLMPRHRAMIAHFKAHGLPVIYHTDGNCAEAVGMLIEAGIDCLQPLEVRAGLDVRPLAEAFGDRIAFMGNISVEGLARGGAEMRQEIESKVKAMTAGGFRYIFHSDHSVPDQVPLAHYRQAMEIVAECGAY